MFGSKFPVLPVLLALVAVSFVNCQDSYYHQNKNHGKTHDLYDNHNSYNTHKDVGYDHFDMHIENTCEAGDYYITSHVLGFYVAYATKYKGLKVTPNCPVAVLAWNTFVNTEGGYTYFWNKNCGTIQVIMNNPAVEFLCSVFDQIDVEQVFNELVGIKGYSLTKTSIFWAEKIQETLLYVLDQTHNLKYLLNFNGALLYANIFPERGIHINADKSPLCELVYINNIPDFMAALETQSSLVRALRALSSNDKYGSNHVDYYIKNPNVCYRNIFGCLSVLETLPEELKCLYNLANLSYHGVDINNLCEIALTVDGLASHISKVRKLWVDDPPNYNLVIGKY